MKDNPQVAELQRMLNQLGYTNAKGNALNADGDFGSSTEQAVIKFQKANNLTANGVIVDTHFNVLKAQTAAQAIRTQAAAPAAVKTVATPTTTPAAASPEATSTDHWRLTAEPRDFHYRDANHLRIVGVLVLESPPNAAGERTRREYPFISGASGNGAIPEFNPNWTQTDRVYDITEQKFGTQVARDNALGWEAGNANSRFWLQTDNPGNGRDAIGIHPDGNVVGTFGCFGLATGRNEGIEASYVRTVGGDPTVNYAQQFMQQWQSIPEAQRPTQLTVEPLPALGAPQSARATEHTRTR
ncbi:MAG: peptidoglycan-binding domain-containing protein [Rickettsiales bacterium]|nr:peptidoglycan-binding domain-containing protein [Rickettsiales bacterium]